MSSSANISGKIDADNTDWPSLPHLFVWEDGTPSLLRCLACGSESPCPRVLSIANLRSPSEILALHTCPQCQSHFFHPMPDTNYTEGYTDKVAAYHLLQGTSLEFALTALSALERRNGRLLDVGCGPGLIVDLWERLELGAATGIEPSPVGKFAIAELRRNIRVLHLDEDAETADGAFDVVLSTEVLEHVSDPISFLRAMSKKVAPAGVLIFSTPNVGLLGKDYPAPSNLKEALSPGFHVTLFSEAALHLLLKKLGWPHVRLVDHEGHWIVYASREPLKLNSDPAWMDQMHRSYLERASLDPSLSSRARSIFGYRLFCKLANEGNWIQTDTLLPGLGDLFPTETAAWVLPGGTVRVDRLSDDDLRRWLGNYYHLPALFFLLGIRAKNHLREVSAAIQLFQLSARLARLTILHLLDDAYTKEIYWNAQLNAGVALLESGNEAAGMEILERVGISLDLTAKTEDRLLPQMKFVTRARLEIFKHQTQSGQWEKAGLTFHALQGYLAANYSPWLLRISGWLDPATAWPEEWSPLWYFYGEYLLELNLGRYTQAARGFSELHRFCQEKLALPEARDFLVLSQKHAELARSGQSSPRKKSGIFRALRARLIPDKYRKRFC